MAALGMIDSDQAATRPYDNVSRSGGLYAGFGDEDTASAESAKRGAWSPALYAVASGGQAIIPAQDRDKTDHAVGSLAKVGQSRV